MKKHSLIKLIALIVSVAAMAAVFGGCIFAYDEDADLAQVILEINPVEIEYDVPLYTDYLDPDGKPVYEIDNDRNSANFGQPTSQVVRAVKRTHDGFAIHKPKTDASGNVLYIGYVARDEGGFDEKEVTASDASVDKEKTSDRYFVEPVSGDEYFYIGLFKSGTAKCALWQKVSDRTTAYGRLSYDGATPDALTHSASFNYVEELPVINYDSAARLDANFWWEKLSPVYEKAKYVSEKEEFFKVTLINYFENYAYNLITEQKDKYKTVDDVFDYFIKNFYTSYLSRAEADAATAAGNVEWGVTEINDVNKAIYDGIDAQLQTIYKEIAADFGKKYPDVSEDTSSDSTYPTPGEEEKEDVYKKDYKLWHISQEYDRCIGHDTSGNRNSLEREGVRRLVDYISTTIEDSYAIMEGDRAHYEAEIAEMRIACSTVAGIDKLYTQLYTYDVVKYMYGESEEYSKKTESHKEFIGKDRKLSTDSEIQQAYAELLADQSSKFQADIENYYSACKNNETVLYFADDEYFWVKHILIPFSDAQTASLTEFKNGNNSDADIKAYRQWLGDSIEVYKHVDGENDTSKTYSIDEAYAEINAKMSSADAFAAEHRFNDLIYTYNTDPGIFDNEMGYAVTRTSEAAGGAAESYMIEFAREARALYYAYKNDESLYSFKSHNSEYEVSRWDAEFCTNEVEIGSISAPVLTDYGWHIMYLSYVPTSGYKRALNEYMTAGRYSTVKDVLGRDVSTGLDTIYATWQENVASKYSNMDGVVISHKENFTKRLKDYEDRFYNADTGEDEEDAAGTTAS